MQVSHSLLITCSCQESRILSAKTPTLLPHLFGFLLGYAAAVGIIQSHHKTAASSEWKRLPTKKCFPPWSLGLPKYRWSRWGVSGTWAQANAVLPKAAPGTQQLAQHNHVAAGTQCCMSEHRRAQCCDFPLQPSSSFLSSIKVRVKFQDNLGTSGTVTTWVTVYATPPKKHWRWSTVIFMSYV